MKSLERLVLAYLKHITRPLLDPLQFAYRAERSVDDAVNMGLHCILQHSTNLGITQGFYLWTSAQPSIPSCLTFSQTNWHSSLCQPPSVSGSPASWQTGSSLWGWANSHPELSPSALVPLRVAYFPHCSSPFTQMTALQRTPLSSSWSLRMTLQSLASSRTETS